MVPSRTPNARGRQHARTRSRRTSGRHCRRAGRTPASAILLYASFLVLVLGMLMVWRWYRARSAGEGEPSPPPSGPVAALPATRPTTQPTQPATTSAPAKPGRPPSNISPAAIELSERERIAFEDVADGVGSVDETAFYMLLGRAAKMPKLSGRDLEALPRPTIANVLAQPSQFRAQPMRVKLRVFEVKKTLLPGPDLSFSRHWPRDRPVWRVHGADLVPPGKTKPPAMIVYMIQDPRPLLGKPDKVRTSGDMEYRGSGRRLGLAAIFYKVYRCRDRDGHRRDYPVFVAWQATGPPASGMAKGGSLLVVFIGIVGVLLIGFLFLRRHLKQIKKTAPGPPARYRPLRDRAPEEPTPPAADDAGAPDAPEETDVDPLLKQAAEEYQKDQKERQQQDGPNGRS